MERMLDRVLVIVPTYNERENLPMIVGRIRAAVPEAHLLIADDNSPDGTGEVADGLAADDDHVSVLHRPGKQGLGAAYIEGFHWGLKEGFDVLVEIDADGSHQPEELPKLLERLADGADLVVGSRWVPGGKVVNWPLSRELLSRGASLYSRIMLGVPIRDATAGFRAYRASTLEKIGLDDVESQGYCFQIDLTLRTVHHGLRVAEVPITFVERTVGASKMSRGIIVEAFWRVAVWGVAGLPRRLRRPR
ncbi:polyprenol monophosphomannose synthase [Streptosporangium carneum]|uniref:Dolichol-phosphate mannosyltransferase n=1 Tax=Streptosporangium carneum TaxID=47481 RepID=A0A9W6I0L0_9ACTN|nr:polyprenol monophosphomannose synthase [Streptosporangium carneum]GLK09812.1 dolichol-phosphate mannosyltransferase [Streptosporangium carneum]